jgi:hypothetical protein
MTVGELREKLDGLNPKIHVVVNHETDGEMELYEVADVSRAKGHPRRSGNTRVARFEFDDYGPTTWLFIATEKA